MTPKKSIVRRWIVNVMGMVLFILITLVLVLSIFVQGYVYNGIQSTLNASSLQLMNFFVDFNGKTSTEFISFARNYVENFPNKEIMELMVINSRGEVVTTSTGFEPDTNEMMPDYEYALQDEEGCGTWTGKLSSGEKVMAVSRVLFSDTGAQLGGIRYLVSLKAADRQVRMIVTVLLIAGLLIILFIVFSGLYFVRSIVNPIKEINATARQIAQGDFDARVEKFKEDEVGQLCDTINDMALELRSAERMKNDFISSVSHELRTPLTAIKGWSETLQEDGISGKTYAKGLSVISREAERLSGIVEELLDFSRMQSGRMTLMMEKIDILAEVGEAVYMFSERASTEKKFLLYEEPENISPVLGDINRLRQVFINIIDNALKYTSEGGTISVSVNEEGGFVHVVVSDNGCGISAEHLPRIKEKFYKANQSVRGSGIGLALADEIVSMHNGTLEVESHENIGTAVTITLPVIVPQESGAKRSDGKEEKKEDE